jgi:hypothetical protein
MWDFSQPHHAVAQTEISRFIANSPELAGIRARILSLQAVDWISGAVSAPLSLPCKIGFPDSRSSVANCPFFPWIFERALQFLDVLDDSEPTQGVRMGKAIP